MEDGPKHLSENLEDYLEAISNLVAQDGYARLTDIANALNVKKPSVSSALNALAERGLIEYEKYRPVILTKKGAELAGNVSRKHKVLSSFLVDVLGVDANEADVAACKMEHALNDDIMKKLIEFVKRMEPSK